MRYNSKNDNVYVASKANMKESLGADMNLLLKSTLGENFAQSYSDNEAIKKKTDEQSHFSRTVASLISTNSVSTSRKKKRCP